MERLTERELMICGNVDYTKCSSDKCFGYCGACDIDKEVGKKLKEYEDLEEQGLLKTVIRGEWKSECGLFLPVCRCSECNFVNLGQTKFCPNCGADMRKKEMEGK